MRNILIALFLMIALSACKKEEKKLQPAAQAPVKQVISVQDLATKSMVDHDDWTKDLEVYIDDVLACTSSSPVQTKYVFRADAFETPPIALILLKGEDDKIYACSLETGDSKPHYKEIRATPSLKAPRFYPGQLPKVDSCLLNTRVLDKTGQIVGWLAKITC